MTIITMRRVGGDFVVTSPDVEPGKFKMRREARDWCTVHYPRLTHQGDRAPSQAPRPAAAVKRVAGQRATAAR